MYGSRDHGRASKEYEISGQMDLPHEEWADGEVDYHAYRGCDNEENEDDGNDRASMKTCQMRPTKWRRYYRHVWDRIAQFMCHTLGG